MQPCRLKRTCGDAIESLSHYSSDETRKEGSRRGVTPASLPLAGVAAVEPLPTIGESSRQDDSIAHYSCKWRSRRNELPNEDDTARRSAEQYSHTIKVSFPFWIFFTKRKIAFRRATRRPRRARRRRCYGGLPSADGAGGKLERPSQKEISR